MAARDIKHQRVAEPTETEIEIRLIVGGSGMPRLA